MCVWCVCVVCVCGVYVCGICVCVCLLVWIQAIQALRQGMHAQVPYPGRDVCAGPVPRQGCARKSGTQARMCAGGRPGWLRRSRVRSPYSSLAERSSSAWTPPTPRAVALCAAEAVRTVWRSISTRTHSLSLLGPSLGADEAESDVRGQAPPLSTAPLEGLLGFASLLTSQHSGSSLVRKVS